MGESGGVALDRASFLLSRVDLWGHQGTPWPSRDTLLALVIPLANKPRILRRDQCVGHASRSGVVTYRPVGQGSLSDGSGLVGTRWYLKGGEAGILSCAPSKSCHSPDHGQRRQFKHLRWGLGVNREV